MKFYTFKVLTHFKEKMRMITGISISAHAHLLLQSKKQVFLMDFLVEPYLRQKNINFIIKK